MKRPGHKVALFAFVLFLCALNLSAPGNEEEWFGGDAIEGKRDPFVPLTGAGRRASGGSGRIETIDDVMLEGITWESGGTSLAIINGEIVGEGNKIGNLKIVEIKEDRITVYLNGKQYVIPFRGEGG